MNNYLEQQPLLSTSKLSGRYITLETIRSMVTQFEHHTIGKSASGRPIHCITLGTGPIKVLLWSQMHGNESTATKGIFDVLAYLNQAPELLAQFSLCVLPMLNPDGAHAYTRVNANSVDLNRDAIDQSQPETQVLLEKYNQFNPDFCFNLHDQRTIFGVNEEPCMLSFLAPSTNEAKDLTPARRKAMGVIGAINTVLQEHIPNQVGRYDDTYNGNCTGDYFQGQGTPTILFECGQVGDDYGRVATRKWFGLSVITALKSIADDYFNADAYNNIPEVAKTFVDVVIKNVMIKGKQTDIALQYEEALHQNTIQFIPKVHTIGNLGKTQGHRTVDFNGKSLDDETEVTLGQNASFLLNVIDLTKYSH